MERKLSLKSAAEWSGARKVLNALKKAKKIKGQVKLESPRAKRRNPKKRGMGLVEEYQIPGTRAYYKIIFDGLYYSVTGTDVSGAHFDSIGYPRVGRARKYAKLHIEGRGRKKPSREQYLVRKMAKRAGRLANGRRRNIAAGFVDEDGVFHPIRASFDYSRSRAGEGRKRSGGKKKKGARKRNTTAAKLIVTSRGRSYRWYGGNMIHIYEHGQEVDVFTFGGSAGGPITKAMAHAAIARKIQGQNPLSKNAAFVRRMRLGRLRAVRRRARR